MYATLSRMKTTPSRNRKQPETQEPEWPRKVQPGRSVVRVYRRMTPSGHPAFMVANYADGDTRRFDSYKTEAEAMSAAETLAKRLDKRDYVAASMTKAQALDYASAAETLKPWGLSLSGAASALAECLKTVADLANLHAAVKFYKERHKQVTPKRVSEVVADLLAVKQGRGASARYMADLKTRLERFAEACNKDCCNVTTADIQDWLDNLKTDGESLSPQSYRNYRTVLHTLFGFAVARGYAVDNPVASVEKVKVRAGDVEVFTPAEIERLLESARVNAPAFLPALAIGAFAGLRSAEIERLEWKDVDLAARHITVSAGNAKTASRRIVPVADNLAAWLLEYANKQGKVWPGGHFELYDTQQAVARATEVKPDESKGVKAQPAVPWKANALRHSYASYRFASIGDAGRVAGEMGNSASVIHRHYRELVKPAAAAAWFAVRPERPANVVALARA